MLHDLSWLAVGQSFPPASEQERLDTYSENIDIFNSVLVDTYEEYARRVDRVIGYFSDFISFPIIFNYQRLMSLKMADLVCGEYPTVTGVTPEETDTLKLILNDSDFNSKIYTTVLDISRLGDAIWRIYKDEKGKYTFTVWDPRQWFPIVSQDGTNTILQHVLCWVENRGTALRPDWYSVAQEHYNGYYIQRVFKAGSEAGQILAQVSSEKVSTGLSINAVMHIRAFTTSDTVYGYDDYKQIDSIVCELMTRVSQISNILDKHADPALTGPTTMLTKNLDTGELEFKKGKFYATSPGDTNEPHYLVWNGQLEAAFVQVEFLVGQLYILSEMGAALAGGKDSSLDAVSGAAMRFKMVTPLAKARRISNSLTRQVKELLASLSLKGYDKPIEAKDISIAWSDGIPNDPRETIEYVKLATGENKIMPLDVAIVTELGKTSKEAEEWIKKVDERAEAAEAKKMANLDAANPEQKGVGPGPVKGQVASSKGSVKGLTNANPIKQN